MNRNFPIWVDLLRKVLRAVARLGQWCDDKNLQLLETKCRCEFCREKKKK